MYGADALVVQTRNVASHETHLVERQALAHTNWERGRHYLYEEWPLVTRADLVEQEAVVSDHSGKYVQAARGALRVRFGPDPVGQIQPRMQLDEIRHVGFEETCIP